MRSGEFLVLKVWVVVCVFFATLQPFATIFEFVAAIAVTGRLKFVRQGKVYIPCCGEGAGVGEPPRSWLFKCGYLESYFLGNGSLGKLAPLCLCLTRSIFGLLASLYPPLRMHQVPAILPCPD